MLSVITDLSEAANAGRVLVGEPMWSILIIVTRGLVAGIAHRSRTKHTATTADHVVP